MAHRYLAPAPVAASSSPLLCPADRARIWADLQALLDGRLCGDLPETRVRDSLFYHVDNPRMLCARMGVALPDWYRQKFGPWLWPSPFGIGRTHWGALTHELTDRVHPLVDGPGPYALVAYRNGRHVQWRRVHPQDRMLRRRRPRRMPDSLTLKWEAQQASRCLFAMVGLSRALPDELCWAILGWLDLVSEPV